MRRRSVQITLLVLGIVAALFIAIPPLVDERENKLLKKPPYAASERALKSRSTSTRTFVKTR